MLQRDEMKTHVNNAVRNYRIGNTSCTHTVFGLNIFQDRSMGGAVILIDRKAYK